MTVGPTKTDITPAGPIEKTVDLDKDGEVRLYIVKDVGSVASEEKVSFNPSPPVYITPFCSA